MTAERAKAIFGNDDTGYVRCGDCPLDGLDGERCPRACKGMDDAWEA